MTEIEWETGTDPTPMLQFVRGKMSDRKLRLFAAAAFGRLAALLPDPRQRRGIEVLEQLGEGTIALDACRGVASGVRHAIPPDEWSPGSPPPIAHSHYTALMLYREFCSSSIAVHAVHAADGLADGVEERREQARLMRCIFGNPFRSRSVDARRLGPAVVSLARTIYAGRAFDRLPILAEALEATGCDDNELLAHCRSEGPHVRGCWVIDAVLRKT
jgi:hypothetical protein